jgi:ATP-dependent helicase HepA
MLNPDAMHGSELPLLDRGQAAVTFDRHTALIREDLEFMTWDHPLLGDTMELLLASGAGNAGFAIFEDADAPGVRLEALFVLESVAPPRLHIDRFLPPTPVVVAVDQSLAELAVSDDVDFSDGRPEWIADHQPVLRPAIEKMAERCEALAEERATDEKRRAAALLRETLEGELDRLRALARVNDQIRPEEIEAVQADLAELEQTVADARLRLDAMRLVWCGPAQEGVPVTRR